MNELKPCPKCGGKAEMRLSFGGPVVYYGIYCKCGHNNRHYHSEALLSHGLSSSGEYPPSDNDIAINDWNNQEAKQ